MLIKVDEDLPEGVAALLRARSYDAASIREQGMGGWKDPEIWTKIQAEQRFLITADKGFADIRFHPPGHHEGVLLLRPDEDGIRPLMQLVGQLLASIDLKTLAGCVAVATPRGLRVRRAVP
jgi:predicted nuclease of predicted toxin-antitoxin system